MSIQQQQELLKTQPSRLAFTILEAAEAAHISRRTVVNLVRSGRLKAVRIGRCVRIPRHSLLSLCGEE